MSDLNSYEKGLANDLAKAQVRIKELEAKLNWVLEERDTTFALMLKRAESAESKLSQAVEALHDAISLMPDDEGPEIDFIRTTLAELEGEKYE
jgi:hypothetical protein